MENKPMIGDIFGIGPYGESLKLVLEKSIDGIGVLLGKLCLPAAEEFGLMFRDKTRARRLQSLIQILDKANGKFDLSSDLAGITVHPRILKELMESGTWCEDSLLQEMWAGLLVSSLEKGDAKGKNVLFLDSIKKITSIQAKILEFACKNCKVKLYESGLLMASKIQITHEDMVVLTGEDDLFQLDAEIDNLRAQELISSGGYDVRKSPLVAEFCPSAFALNLYAKTQGHQGNLSAFYHDQLADSDDPDFRPITLLSV